MKVRINKKGTEATLEVSTYEGYTLWIALQELAKGYQESLAVHTDDPVTGEPANEDKMFLHGELAKVYTMMYQMCDDFTGDIKRQAQAFFEEAFPLDREGNPTHKV